MSKTKPHTIRFEETDFDFICKREELNTAQQVVSFLLSEYIKLYKVEKKSVFDVKEETKTYDLPKDYIPVSSIKITRSFEYYKQARIDCETEEDWRELKKEILDSDLPQRQKALLTT